MNRRSSLTILAASCLAALALSVPSQPLAAGSTGGGIVINPNSIPAGALPIAHGYDIKQEAAAQRLTFPGAVDRYFGSIASGGLGMKILRMPIFAIDAHPTSNYNDVDAQGAWYDQAVTATKMLPDYNNDAKYNLFASLVLRDGSEFPAWTKTDGHINPPDYGLLIFHYLKYMRVKKDIIIDHIGIDNESTFNDGGITPARYAATVTNVRSRINAHNASAVAADDIPEPKFLSPENYGPDPTFLNDLLASEGNLATTGPIGTHYYGRERADNPTVQTRLISLANIAASNNKPLWNTEFHFDTPDLFNAPQPNEYTAARISMFAAADNFDNGASGFVWWLLKPTCPGATGTPAWCETTPEAALKTAVELSTANAFPLNGVEDQDSNNATSGEVTTRAFKRNGSSVYVWVLNDTANNYSSGAAGRRLINVTGWQLPANYAPTYQQWKRGTNGVLTPETTGAATFGTANDQVSVDMPPYSITIVRMPLP